MSADQIAEIAPLVREVLGAPGGKRFAERLKSMELVMLGLKSPLMPSTSHIRAPKIRHIAFHHLSVLTHVPAWLNGSR